MSRSPHSTRIFVYDEQLAVREGLRRLFDRTSIRVVGDAGTVPELLAQLDRKVMDALVLEPMTDGRRDIGVLDQVRKHFPKARILVYSSHAAVPFIASAYEAGAKGFVTKTSDRERLRAAVLRVAEGGKYFSPEIAEQLAGYYTDPKEQGPRSILTERECEIFVRLAAGQGLAAIAKELGLSLKSVQNRAVTVRYKLGIERKDFHRVAVAYDLIPAAR